jgi:hypothetical protein
MSSSLCAGSGQPLTQRVVRHTDYRLLVVPAIYVVTPGAYLLVASKGCNSSQLEAHSACLLTCHPQPIVDGVRFHVVPLKSWLSPSGESEQPEQGSLPYCFGLLLTTSGAVVSHLRIIRSFIRHRRLLRGLPACSLLMKMKIKDICEMRKK